MREGTWTWTRRGATRRELAACAHIARFAASVAHAAGCVRPSYSDCESASDPWRCQWAYAYLPGG